MNEPTTTAPPAKKQAPAPAPTGPSPLVKLPDDAMRVRELKFGAIGGVDFPSEQRLARLNVTADRNDKPRYEIWYVPRWGMYYVQEYAPKLSTDKPGDAKRFVQAFTIPREWALAVLESGS